MLTRGSPFAGIIRKGTLIFFCGCMRFLAFWNKQQNCCDEHDESNYKAANEAASSSWDGAIAKRNYFRVILFNNLWLAIVMKLLFCNMICNFLFFCNMVFETTNEFYCFFWNDESDCLICKSHENKIVNLF